MAVHHGIKINDLVSGARSLGVATSAVIGIVATASGAAAEAMFPAGIPTRVTDIDAAITAAGNTGTLAKVIDAIADQANPILIVVRVPVIADAEDQAAAVLAAIPYLLTATSHNLPAPDVIGAPGLETAEITAELAVVARKLISLTYSRALGATVENAIEYAGDFSADELMLFWPDFSDFTGSAVARALGLRAYIDQNMGWNKTISNVAVQGATGLSTPVYFDMTGMEGDTKLLNDANIVAVINHSGFRFWGNRTMSDEPLYAFESAVRTRQILRRTIGVGLIPFIDKPITAFLVKEIIDTINNLFDRLKRQRLIVGATARYVAANNPPAELAGGKLAIEWDFTPTAPLESLTGDQIITDTYYADLTI